MIPLEIGKRPLNRESCRVAKSSQEFRSASHQISNQNHGTRKLRAAPAGARKALSLAPGGSEYCGVWLQALRRVPIRQFSHLSSWYLAGVMWCRHDTRPRSHSGAHDYAGRTGQKPNGGSGTRPRQAPFALCRSTSAQNGSADQQRYEFPYPHNDLSLARSDLASLNPAGVERRGYCHSDSPRSCFRLAPPPLFSFRSCRNRQVQGQSTLLSRSSGSLTELRIESFIENACGLPPFLQICPFDAGHVRRPKNDVYSSVHGL